MDVPGQPGHSARCARLDALPAEANGAELKGRGPSSDSSGAPLLEVKNWTVYHPVNVHRKMIDAVDLVVRSGEVVGGRDEKESPAHADRVPDSLAHCIKLNRRLA